MADPSIKHTPGPWRWFGNTKSHDLHLATEGGGRIFVLNFVRWGMGSAQPRFQGRGKQHGVMVPATELVTYEVDYRRDISGIDHPDARLIAAAPDLLDALRTTARNLSTLNGVRADQGIRGFGDWLAVVEAAIAKAEGR